MADSLPTKEWVIELRNTDHPAASIDLSQLATGAGPVGNNMWGGPFTGRPHLLRDFWPSLKHAFFGLSPKRAHRLLGSLRSFWRYLDARESYFEGKQTPYQRIENLHHISGVIFDSYLHDGPTHAWKGANVTHGRTIRSLIEFALQDADIPIIATNAIPASRRPLKDTPSDEQSLALIRYLRSRTLEVFRRWDRADRLAAQGRDLALMVGHIGRKGISNLGATTEADAHATYRGFVSRSEHPNPSSNDFWRTLGYERTNSHQARWWPRTDAGIVGWAELEAGLYPTSGDVSIIALLCLGRLAWNPSTLLSIDINKWHMPYDDRHVWVFAPKSRAGGSYQHGISDIKQPSGVYSVLERLIQRSMALRTAIAANPSLHRTPLLAQRSPFVGLNLWSETSRAFFVADREGDKTLNNWLRQCITQHNQEPGSVQVGPMTCSDFRDVAAAVMYRDSRYSLWVKQLMLGHKSQHSTTAYGYRHATRQESHRLVQKAVESVLDQSRATGIWDPTVTRANFEGVDIGPKAMSRLTSYRSLRTYSGANCADPLNPPSTLDPAHPRDGRTLCAQGHLCVARLCPKATVVKDSLDSICRSVSEYQWRRDRLGAVRWANSSAAEDLANLELTLSQWPDSEVLAGLKHWQDKIQSGQHIPLQYGGSHAEE